MNKIKTNSAEIKIPNDLDMTEFNKHLKRYEISLESFEVMSKGYLVNVDLENKSIWVNNKLVVNESSKDLKNIRWINFRRNTVTFPGGQTWIYGIGFQGSLNGENVKKIILVDRDSWRLE